MAIVNTNTNLSAVTYATGETITIRNGAVLTVDSTPTTRPGTIQCITSGKLRVENTSTTTPIVLALDLNTRDFQFESNGILEVRGNMMEIGTGTNAVQSFDFSTLYGGVLTDITYVEVEQSAGSDDYIPWHIVDITPTFYDARIPTSRASIKTDFDGNQNVFFYDSLTRLLETGDNTNGKSVPTGCKIRIPNILITNQDWQPDVCLAHAIISQGTPTGGTFTITVTNRRTSTVIGTTAAIPYNATSAQLDTALEAILGAGTVTPGGGPLPTALSATLAGAYASLPIAFTVNSSVTGGTNSIIYSRENAASNMTLVDLNPSGTADCECVMFSNKVRWATTTFAGVRFYRVGVGSDVFSLTSSTGGVTLDHVSAKVNPYNQSTTHAPASSVFGPVIFNKLVMTNSSGQAGFAISTLPALEKFDDVRHMSYTPPTSTSGYSMIMTSLKPNVPIIRLHCLGGELNFTNCIGNPVVSARHTDSVGTTQRVAPAVHGVVLINCINMLFSDFQKLGTAAPRNALFLTDAQSSGIQVVSGTYDASNNCFGLVLNQGVGFDVSNFEYTNSRTASILIDHPTTFLGTQTKAKKVFATMIGTNTVDSGQDAEYDVLACSVLDFNEVNASVNNFVGGNFVDYGTSPTTGHVTYGAFGSGTGLTLTGTAFTSQTGFINLFTDGDTAIAEIPFSMHAITSLQNDSPRYFLQGAGVFANQHTVIAPGVPTGGTFTISVYDTSDVLVGTTVAIAYNATTTTVDTAIETIVGVGVTVSGALSTGLNITMPTGTIYRITVNGAALTGGAEPGVAYAYGRMRLLAAESNLGAGLTMEFQVRNGGTAAWPGTWTALTGANLSTAIAGLTGYDANAAGLDMRIKMTAVGNDPFRNVQQVSVLTNVNPAAWTVDDASLNLQGPGPTDVTKILRASDDAVLYTFTGSGVKTFTVGANYNAEVYFRRENSTGTVLMRTLPKTYVIGFGNNGDIPLFYGDEVQLAQVSDIVAIKAKVDAYLDATISSRSTQTSVDKTLTTSKFLALK